MDLPEAFLNRMKTQLGGDFAAYLRAMEEPPRRALRVNTLKIQPDAFAHLCDFPLTPSGVLPEAFFFPADLSIGRHPLHLAGLCYVQEPAAMLPVTLLDVRPGMRVLDLCAAPGGKSGQVAALLEGDGLLVANEPVGNRAQVLSGNLERLGAVNAAVTNLYPEALSKALPGFFDRVLVDAPCSGEGMFRKEPAAIRDWSPANVSACAARQGKILADAAALLKPGGRLVYSTCTFSPEEDEGAVDAFLAAHPDFTLLSAKRLYPHTFSGEGQFMAVFSKCYGDFPGEKSPAPPVKTRTKGPCNPKPQAGGLSLWTDFAETCLTRLPPCAPRLLPDGRVVLLPEDYPGELSALRVLRAGIPAGEVKRDRFLPAHGLAMAYPFVRFRREVPLEGDRLAAYLNGEALPDAGEPGWCAVTANGYPVGLGKGAGGQLKNHLPKGLRVPR